MNKHTPGPWNATKINPVTGDIDDCYLYVEPGIAVIERKVKGRDQYDAANARLIAAAPDLLEALEALADSAPSACCVDFHHKPGDYHDADESCPALDRYEAACLSARAAIARARGEA